MQVDSSLGGLLLQVCSENDIQPVGTPSSGRPQARDGDGGQRLSQRLLSVRSRDALSQIRESGLKPFQFARTDLLVIAALFQQYMELDRPVSVVNLLRTAIGQPVSSVAHISQVSKLALDGILTLSKPGGLRIALPVGMLHANCRLEEDLLQGYEVSLSKPFLRFLIQEGRPVLQNTGYKSNREFLNDGFRCCQAAQRYYNVPQSQWRVDLYDIRVVERYRSLMARLSRAVIDIPLRNLIKEYGLRRQEQLALLHLIERESSRVPTDVNQVSTVVEPDQMHRSAIEAVQSPDGTLRRHGLVDTQEQRTPQGTRTLVNIEPGLFRYIVSDGQLDSKISVRDICTRNPAVTISSPIKSLDHLILPDTEMRLLTSVIQSCHASTQRTLRKWGVIPAGTLNLGAEGAGQALILLHGRPGVGKTLAADVIATEMGKKQMRADISQIHSKWIGESEKNLRSVFRSYEELVRKDSNPPILFLNECDQFLSRRIENTSRATDQLFNTLQNMLLEFLEGFSGVCIATTNLVSNLDPAFSRRFTHKIEIPWPDSSTREKLWNTLIPSALPTDPDVNAQVLADEYSFSGSQIRTVIHNAAQDVASRTPDQQFVAQSDLIRFAELERSGSFDGSQTCAIGFGQSQVRCH